MRTFAPADDGIEMRLRDQEVELLRRLTDELRTALDQGDGDDAIVSRLFPPAVLGDPAADEEVRDLLADALLEDRLEGLEAVTALLDRGRTARGRTVVTLTDGEPLQVLTVLNDIRLAIGARIDVEALDRDTVTEDHPAAEPVAIMDHLGWWQEQLLAILDGGPGEVD